MRLVYSSDPQKRSAASAAVEAVLQGHSDQAHTVTVLLDCIRCVGILSLPANYFCDDVDIVNLKTYFHLSSKFSLRSGTMHLSAFLLSCSASHGKIACTYNHEVDVAILESHISIDFMIK